MIEKFYLILLIVQFFHSIEELSTGFHKKFPAFKMSFRFFLIFEVVFFSFWIGVYLWEALAYRNQMMEFFNLLMFANGLWHLVWWGIVKKYVPGLVTAPLFVVVFLAYYFQMIV